MSTKAIREALELADAYAHTGDDDEQRLLATVKAALAEVDAIESAAKWMYEITDTSKVPNEEYERCCKVLYAIYQQAKAR